MVKLAERPAISKLEITGNKDIKTEDLMKGLREIGLTEGETFNRLELDRLTQELVRQMAAVNRPGASFFTLPRCRPLLQGCGCSGRATAGHPCRRCPC